MVVSALITLGEGLADFCPEFRRASWPDCKLEEPGIDSGLVLIDVTEAFVFLLLVFVAGFCLGSLRRTSPAPTRASSGTPKRTSKDDRVLFNAAAGSW